MFRAFPELVVQKFNLRALRMRRINLFRGCRQIPSCFIFNHFPCERLVLTVFENCLLCNQYYTVHVLSQKRSCIHFLKASEKRQRGIIRNLYLNLLNICSVLFHPHIGPCMEVFGLITSDDIMTF